MSTIQYVLLTLLAREPLSGYDMKQQMDGRIHIFYKINNNQLYPVLSKLEAEGLVQLQSFERESYRPARKVYEITEAGIEKLKAWVIEPSEPGAWDEFLLKQYSAWLVDPDTMIKLLKEKKLEHQNRLQDYIQKVDGFREQYGRLTSEHPIFSTIAVVEMGIGFERSYMEWCDKMIGWLQGNQI
ncbi:DNA-binding transcriptional regulator, PadR family [Paenibacillus sp. 1_12]|uniref:PadR family transcriptional regulator n=1 Tax=Paenibacillus sp. 1_12 TaxID=1566278 RepID=UPI0008E2CC75|nr:PadR family transcriptional regulator [Paenibacillus sp. 1_12]SFL16582.1 DNA-binding transcriptional regulator, PadR family [Paenibacillus sp. 1_12]